jgi:S-formylglutathione hydrolase FrmB
METLVLPRGTGRGRPLLVFLHGRGQSPDANLSQPLFDALRDLGPRAPDIVFASGGDHSYWHDRRDGDWGSYVLREVLPATIRRAHADAHRVAIGGISMGGFGALDLARLAPREFCAVGAHSPALWLNGGDTAPGAFDDAEDFDHNDLIRFAAAHRLYRIPVWIDVGRDDPFLSADTRFARELRMHGTYLSFQLHNGGHGGWSHRMPEYLRFYANALSRC